MLFPTLLLYIYDFPMTILLCPFAYYFPLFFKVCNSTLNCCL